MAIPIYPNVPNAPGVPPVLRRAVEAVGSPLILAIADTLGLDWDFGFPRWGIYREGQLAIRPDSFGGLEFRQDWAIADFPLEQGAFETYDKVNSPYALRIRLSAGGSEANRTSFLRTAHELSDSDDMFDVLTPEKTYTQVNISHLDYRRESRNGAGLITVDLWFLEIRMNAVTAFSDTKQPQGASPVSNGTVQPTEPKPNQSALQSIFQ